MFSVTSAQCADCPMSSHVAEQETVEGRHFQKTSGPRPQACILYPVRSAPTPFRCSTQDNSVTASRKAQTWARGAGGAGQQARQPLLPSGSSLQIHGPSAASSSHRSRESRLPECCGSHSFLNSGPNFAKMLHKQKQSHLQAGFKL